MKKPVRFDHILCDLDGTILQRWNTPDEEPASTEYLGRILELGPVYAICTNQGGIAWQLVGGRPEKQYPDWPATLHRIRTGLMLTGARHAFVALSHPGAMDRMKQEHPDLIRRQADRIGLPIELLPPDILTHLNRPASRVVQIRMGEGLFLHASWEPFWRKPSPGMILYACQTLGIPVTKSVAYVGDEPDDLVAAERAGVTGVLIGPQIGSGSPDRLIPQLGKGDDDL